MGMPNLQELFDEKYYRNLTGGILEAFGRLFSRDLILFVYPMLNAHGHTYHAADAEVHPRFKPIFDYLLHNKRIRDIEEFDPDSPGFSDEGISTMLDAMEKLGFYIEDKD